MLPSAVVLIASRLIQVARSLTLKITETDVVDFRPDLPLKRRATVLSVIVALHVVSLIDFISPYFPIKWILSFFILIYYHNIS